jgi:hypothetical protein
MRFDRFLTAGLVIVASLALLYGGLTIAAAVQSTQADRQHTLDCAEQGRPVAGCCRSRLDPQRTSCPLPVRVDPAYQVIP